MTSRASLKRPASPAEASESEADAVSEAALSDISAPSEGDEPLGVVDGLASSAEPAEVVVERVLCCNVVQGSRGAAERIFRHPIFAYDERVPWPPSGWEAMACLHCGEALTKPPVPVATSFDRGQRLYRVSGVFCSFPCGKANLLETRGFAAGDAALLLEGLARDAFGYEGPELPRAPPRHRLKRFGGDLDVPAFGGAEAQSCHTMRPPLLSRPEVYERHGAVREADGWSVRGTRAQPPCGAAASAASGSEPSMFSAFVASRPAPPPLARSEARASADLTSFIRRP